jgi:hypothetical protein
MKRQLQGNHLDKNVQGLEGTPFWHAETEENKRFHCG